MKQFKRAKKRPTIDFHIVNEKMEGQKQDEHGLKSTSGREFRQTGKRLGKWSARFLCGGTAVEDADLGGHLGAHIAGNPGAHLLVHLLGLLPGMCPPHIDQIFPHGSSKMNTSNKTENTGVQASKADPGEMPPPPISDN